MTALALATLMPVFAASPTLFVALAGSDAGNNCQLSTTPCRHIAYAITKSASGDTIDIAAGTYLESVTIGDSIKLVGPLPPPPISMVCRSLLS